ncbi:amino acid transporter [Desulfosporosinus orientis DSM 765]|uniref:Amino acid transporter n=1 Tax=Desulfosporosinus orientis (strain ATCC 19365 / DSM 765 / NCIMB 8382 / VKM B-1628 / Singapore I) TaxID=768706 RepID=G7WIU2_DESOD|nr:APC family permease [Desulfosporosinus orientis]AET69166.1 amino acid transporter [Desulfosporosinus orientis DSM 765]
MDDSSVREKSIGYWSVVSIGIGGMVGGGIFAVLGLAVKFAKGGTPIAFAIAGLVALVTSYSYARLSVAYPSRGGTVEFLNQAFGSGLAAGGLNILLWLSYVIMLSLYAYAFGSYGAMFFPEASQLIWKHVLISGIVILLTCLNLLNAKVIGEWEEWIVGFKIIILVLFIFAGLASTNMQAIQPSTWTDPFQLIAGGMIIFLAYEGFELIANAAGEMRNPGKTIPKAYYTAVGFVILLYVAIAVVTLGNLPVDQIITAQDYALAAAAKPFLGSFGYTLITIAALLSTASAINATLYGASRVSYTIAKEGELPAVLEKKIWQQPLEGLFITSGLTLIVANFFNLSSISTMGSAGFLIIFGAVNYANYRLFEKTHSRRGISLAGMLLCFAALAILVWQTAREAPSEIWVLIIMVVVSFVIEASYRQVRNKL